MGFLKLYSGFQSPGFRIPSTISWISESGFPKWEECDDAEGICQKLCCTFRVFALLNKPVVFFFIFSFPSSSSQLCPNSLVTLPRRTILDICDDFLKKQTIWRNRPDSLMLQILQGQKILYFCALVHACMRNTNQIYSCGSRISFQIQNLECLLLVYYH